MVVSKNGTIFAQSGKNKISHIGLTAYSQAY
jgi:hypothetical protein